MLDYHEIPNKPGIYRLTCHINGKVYVGQAKSMFKRVRNHLYTARSRRKATYHDYAIYQAINKYGIENFTADVLDVLDKENIKLLTQFEYYWFIALNAHISLSGYNILIPGCWGNVDQFLTPEKKKRKSEKLSRANINRYPTEATRQRLSIAATGRKQTPEWVEKRISKIRGRPSSLKGRKKPDAPPFILTPDQQQIAFLSNSRTLCLKFRSRYTGEIKYFYGCQEASRVFNIHRTTLTDVIIRNEIPHRGIKKQFF
jgi:group I intron endonuclease